MSDVVTLAVIGLGWIGRRHAELIRDAANCELLAVCDQDVKHAAHGTSWGVPFYADMETLLDRESPDGVIIATPTESHAEVAKRCFQRGIHVLVEKPVAETVDDAVDVIQHAETAGAHVLVGHHRRHSSLVQTARDWIRNDIGQLVGVSVLWATLKPADYFTVLWRRNRPGGGPTFINLIHEFDTLRFLCGDIEQVFAQGSSRIRKFEVEDSLSINLRFRCGALGSVLASDTAAAPWSYEATTQENPDYFHAEENCYHFLGTEGSFAFPRLEMWKFVDAARMGWHDPMCQSRPDIRVDNPLESQLKHFCRVVRGEELPLVSALEGAKSLALACAVLNSIEQGRPIDPREAF